MTLADTRLSPLLPPLTTWWQRLAPWRKAQMAAATLACLVLVILGARPHNSGQLIVEVRSSASGPVQVFFDQGQGFTETGSWTQHLPPGSSRLHVPLPAGRTLALRLDPPADAYNFDVNSAQITGNQSLSPNTLVSQPLNEILPLASDGHQSRYQLQDRAVDPQLLLALPTPFDNASERELLLVKLFWILTGICIVLILGLQMAYTHSYRWPSLACSVMVLALACFATTSSSVNPDEDLHEAGAHYFSSHWAPPALDSPQMQDSYRASPYGVSYLAEWNVTYLLAGKAGNLATSAGLTERQGYRLYQASLLLLLILAVWLLRLSPFTLAPILLTPQAWYVFSYMNGDALPLAAASLAAGIALTRDSPLRAYLLGERRIELQVIMHAAMLAACLGMLLISKRNYWPVAVFIVCALASASLRLPTRSALSIAVVCSVGILWSAGGQALQQRYDMAGVVVALILAAMAVLFYDGVQWLRQGQFKPAYRLAAVFALAFAVAAPWISIDVLRNGTGEVKTELVERLREKHAAEAFKPSATTRAPGLRMNEQGYALPQMLQAPLDWHIATSKSLFGVYGYMQYYAPNGYYMTIWVAAGLLVLLAGCTAFTAQPAALGQGQLVLALGAAASLVGASLLHSWTYDFQAQGRYVLGITVLLGAQLSHLRPGSLLERLAHVLIAFAVVLGLYSYALVALPNLTR